MNTTGKEKGLALLVCLSLVFALSAYGQITLSSPFLPEAEGSAVAKPRDPLEFRGLMKGSSGILFCLFDRQRKKTLGWVALDEQGDGFVVKSFDPDTDSVLVETRGAFYRLVLPARRVGRLAPQGSPAEVAVVPAGEPSAGAKVVEEVTAATIAQRVEKRKAYVQDAIARYLRVSEEYKRRQNAGPVRREETK